MEVCAGLQVPQSGEVRGAPRPVLAQQNAQAALFEPFAADDVAFGARNRGVSGKELVEVVRRCMDEAALPFEKFGERRTFELSGGEQRRLAIAGVLALDADVIMFDEPSAGLDSGSRTEVMSLLRRLADEGKTVIFSTHKRDEADFADREIVIKDGRVVSDSLSDSDEKTKQESEKLPVMEKTSSANLIAGLKNRVQIIKNLLLWKRFHRHCAFFCSLHCLCLLLWFVRSGYAVWLCLYLPFTELSADFLCADSCQHG